MFLGSWSSVAPLFLRLLGSGTGVSHRCAWGMYGKQTSGDGFIPESRSGADFALVIWRPDGKAHLAMFQAKKSAAIDERSISINPSSKRDRPQAVSLLSVARFAHQIKMRGKSASLERIYNRVLSDIGRADTEGNVGDLYPVVDFAYYLAYLASPWKCLSLTDVGLSYLGHMPENRIVRDSMSLQNASLFETVLDNGFDNGLGWLVCDPGGLKAILPKLVELMLVMGVDGTGRPLKPTVQGMVIDWKDISAEPAGLLTPQQIQEVLADLSQKAAPTSRELKL